MAEAHTQKWVNHHRVKNEPSPDYWERFQGESKGESPEDCADQEKEQTLKNVENSENPGRWINYSEMDDMVKDSHPNPIQGENARNDPLREVAFSKSQGESNNAEHIRQYLGRPDGCIVGSENVEKLLNRKWYSYNTLLISILFKLMSRSAVA